MKLLILNWRDMRHPLAGGAEVSLQEHARYWISQGASVTWFASGFEGAAPSEMFDGMRIIRRGSQFTVHIWASIYYLRGHFRDVDVIMDNFHFIPFFSFVYARRKRIVVQVQEVAKDLWHDNLVFPLSWLGYYLEPLFFLPYRHRCFITCSASTRRDLVGLGIPESNIAVINNGVTLPVHPVTNPKASEPTILFLNRISKDKGIRDVIQLFLDLTKREPRAQLWIAGKEERSGMLTELLKQYGVDRNENITYFGFVDEQKKFSLFAQAWMLVHPSRREGWGLTVIEAAAVGTPTVAYDVPGLRDSIRNGETGVLVGSSDSLAPAVYDLIHDEGRRNRMSTAAKAWAATFDWTHAGRESWALLKQANQAG